LHVPHKQRPHGVGHSAPQSSQYAHLGEGHGVAVALHGGGGVA
jgi:hypothetical protein